MRGRAAGSSLTRSNRRWFWVLVAPFLAGLVVFVYVPMLWSLWLSLFDARNTVTPTAFVGLATTPICSAIASSWTRWARSWCSR
jgi:ABC-type sugar transport system permease subunit